MVHVERALRALALAAHVSHARIYSAWKFRGTGARFTRPLTFQERSFYLRYQTVLRGEELVVFDVGASTGVLTGCLSKLQNVRAVHAFEPIPSVFATLARRTQSYSNVTCHNVALGDVNGHAQIRVCGFSDSSSLLDIKPLHTIELYDTGPVHLEEVVVARLDDLVRERGLVQPHVVKIDVQGYEDRVLAGGRATISRSRYCVLEMSFWPLYEGAPLFDDAYQQMMDMGFRLVGMSEPLVGKSGRHLQVDGIFENEGLSGPSGKLGASSC